MKVKSLIFSFLLVCSSLNAQTIKWREYTTGDYFLLNIQTHELYKTLDSRTWTKFADLTFEGIMPADIPTTTGPGIISLGGESNSKSYILIQCTGQVYTIDLIQKVFKRIDETYYRGANCGAIRFLRKGHMYSFGGYGFWQSTNILTEFDFEGKEWVSIPAKGGVPDAITYGVSGYSPKRDVFITMGSTYLNDTKLYTNWKVDPGIFEFNIDSRTFTRVGEILNQELLDFLRSDLISLSLFTGRYFLIPTHMSKVVNFDTMFIIDVFDNYRLYRWNNPHRLAYGDLSNNNTAEGIIHLIKGDSLQWTSSLGTKLNQSNYGNKLHKYSIKQLIEESEDLGLLTDGSYLSHLYQLGAIVLAIVLILISGYAIFRLRKRKKKKALDFMLGDNEKQFLDFLLLNFKQGYVNGHQIIAFFGRHKASPESQRQFRSKIIENLTKSLGLLFNEKEILEVLPDEKDQRMYTYRLHPKIYKILTSL